MNYNYLALLIMVFLSTGYVVAMEKEQLVVKKPVCKLLLVDKKRIDAHKEHWKNWEKVRTERYEKGTQIGMLAGLVGACYIGYKLWYQPDPIVEDKVKKREFSILERCVTQLEKLQPKVVVPDVPKTWEQKIKEALSDGKGLAVQWIPRMIKGAFVQQMTYHAVNTLWRSPLYTKIIDGTDYAWRSRTMLWLLEKECKLRVAIQSIRRVLETPALLEEKAICHDRVIIAINTFVKETEKIVGHMGFVKELLDPGLIFDRKRADTIIGRTTAALEQLLQTTHRFIETVKVSSDQQLLVTFKQEAYASIASILDQIQNFDRVQSAAGLDEAGDSYPIEWEVDKLRALIYSPTEHREKLKEIHNREKIFDEVAQDQKELAKNFKQQVTSGIGYIIEEIIPSL